MRVPGKALLVHLGRITAEIVQQQEWVEEFRLGKTEGAFEVYASPFEGRLALEHFDNFSSCGHISSSTD
jgi:hypothetical protein